MLKLAVLFWFYKDLDVCKNRLQLIKKYNPNLKIYGLFGGKKGDSENFKEELKEYLDDFYFSPFEDEHFKWINGDLVLLDWYEKRGKVMDWDSVVIVQWDMLVFDSFAKQFPNFRKNQIFLSGLRPLEKYIESRWDWTKDKKERKNYINFLKYLKSDFNYSGDLLCCLFILEIFPKIYFERYSKVKDKKIGMLEYKTPIYAKIFGIPFYEKDMGVWWFGKKQKPLNAVPKEVSENYIVEELKRPNGWRIFHPYYKIWEDGINNLDFNK